LALKKGVLKKDSKNRLMGGNHGKNNYIQKTSLEQQPYGTGKS
jgi:hypothetical protein